MDLIIGLSRCNSTRKVLHAKAANSTSNHDLCRVGRLSFFARMSYMLLAGNLVLNDESAMESIRD